MSSSNILRISYFIHAVIILIRIGVSGLCAKHEVIVVSTRIVIMVTGVAHNVGGRLLCLMWNAVGSVVHVRRTVVTLTATVIVIVIVIVIVMNTTATVHFAIVTPIFIIAVFAVKKIVENAGKRGPRGCRCGRRVRIPVVCGASREVT